MTMLIVELCALLEERERESLQTTITTAQMLSIGVNTIVGRPKNFHCPNDAMAQNVSTANVIPKLTVDFFRPRSNPEKGRAPSFLRSHFACSTESMRLLRVTKYRPGSRGVYAIQTMEQMHHEKNRGEGFCRNLGGGEVRKLFTHFPPKFLQ